MMQSESGKMKGWLKILLALSLAANLGVAGMAAGAFWRHAGGPTEDARRDMGLGPLAFALSKEQRKAYREGLLERLPDLKQGRETLRADFDALQLALSAEPFDPAAVEAAICLVFKRTNDRLAVSQALLVDLVKDMDAAERRAFKDKLAEIFNRSKSKPKRD